MENIISFIFVTLVMFGWCASQLGSAMSNAWKGTYLTVFYCMLLAVFDRFIHFSLFHQELFSIKWYLIDAVILNSIALVFYRISRVKYMVQQYPWKYKKINLFVFSKK